ncbi:MAG: histidine phosphatase family protein [Acidimicrobiales bacterium]
MADPGPRVTLLRHGETPWSKSGQHTGRTDVPLTETGEQQARQAGRELRGRHFDLVLVSPLQRAERTAELAGLVRGELTEDLLEWDYGEIEGRTTAEVQHDIPGWTIWTGPWPGGETPEQVGVRADRVVARIRRQPAGSEVAVVAHGHILRILAARWVGAEARAGRWLALDTAALCELAWEHDTAVIEKWNRLP